MRKKKYISRMTREAIKGLRENALNPLPWKNELTSYSGAKFGSDLKASLNVALLALPQGLAYAAIAELPIIYGVIASAIAAIIAPFFASSRHTILGPTNATAFMVFSFFAGSPQLLERKEALMPILIALVGILCIIGAFAKIAELLQYVSRSVLVGYITGAAVLIITNQLKHLLGVQTEGRTFFEVTSSLISKIPEAHWQPLLLGSITLVLYLCLQKRFSTLPNFAICLIVSALFALGLTHFFPNQGFSEITHFSNISLSDIQFSLPGWGSSSLLSDISNLFGVAMALAFVASLENTVMAKTLSSQTGDRTDVNQDLWGIGMANMACSFVAAMPSSGSLTRSALNFDSGAKTRFASLFCGIFVAVALIGLAKLPFLEHVPKASLAALVIGLGISLINKRNIRICLRSTKSDAIVLIVTFLAAMMVPLHVAIFAGVAVSVIFFLHKASRPNLIEYELSDKGELRETSKRQTPEISIVHVEGDLFFGAAELFQTQVQRTIADPNLRIIILRLKNARNLDATSVVALGDLIRFIRKNEREVIISGVTRPVFRVLKNSGIYKLLQKTADRNKGQSNLFIYTPKNPNLSTRAALLRAQEILGTKKAEIRIFIDQNKQKNKKES